jgi:hypothetical protein
LTHHHFAAPFGAAIIEPEKGHKRVASSEADEVVAQPTSPCHDLDLL